MCIRDRLSSDCSSVCSCTPPCCDLVMCMVRCLRTCASDTAPARLRRQLQLQHIASVHALLYERVLLYLVLTV
eukprot:7644225-Alexandrium_andersonii.AAC.1